MAALATHLLLGHVVELEAVQHAAARRLRLLAVGRGAAVGTPSLVFLHDGDLRRRVVEARVVPRVRVAGLLLDGGPATVALALAIGVRLEDDVRARGVLVEGVQIAPGLLARGRVVDGLEGVAEGAALLALGRVLGDRRAEALRGCREVRRKRTADSPLGTPGAAQ